MNLESKQESEILLRDGQARAYDSRFLQTRGDFGFAAQIHAILRHTRPSGKDVVLDAGCGTGIYSIAIAKRVKKIVCVDFSERSIQVLNEKCKKMGTKNVETYVGDIAEFSFPRSYFTKALVIEVLQHIPTPEKRNAVIKNIRNSLIEGGQLVAVVYRYGGWIRPPKPKEEYDHAGVGLYRLAFEEEDLSKLFLQNDLRLDHIGGILNVPKKFRKWLPHQLSFLDTLVSMTTVSKKLGDYFIAVGTKI